jgi:3-oxoacyl-[acyl-carrier protein] reductase
MDLGLRNKRALVTAASRGLGLASARALATEGARVAMAARSTSSLTREAEALARSGKTETLPVTMDLCDPSSIGRGVDEVIRRWGGIDILITNTPGPMAGEFVTISRESWQAALNMVLLPVIDLLHRDHSVDARQWWRSHSLHYHHWR